MKTVRLTQGRKRRYEGEHAERGVCDYDRDDDNGNSTSFGGEAALGGISHRRLQTTRQAGLGGGGGEGTTNARGSQDQKTQSTQGEKSRGRGEAYFRNLYSTEPDFSLLGQKYPAFGAMLGDGVRLDFTDPAAVMQLTKTLLEEDFGLKIHLLPNRLCPAVPNRHNYILWLKDLLDSTSSSCLEQYEPERGVTGLDIGTGANLIYPLLGCVQRSTWRFLATDIDAESLASARANARANRLESRVHIVDRVASDPLIPLDDLGVDVIDFVMVNPPFYTSAAELLDLAALKSQPPHSACSGAPIEMVCEGGEVGFIERMITESLVLRNRVQWYTAMVGKQSSLGALINTLRRHKISNFAVTTFTQGGKTRRWGIGWSFVARRPSLSASRRCSSLAKGMLPPVTAITIYVSCPKAHTDPIPSLKETLCGMVGSLHLRSWVWDDQRFRGVGFADGNVWSRAYRRRKAGECLAVRQEAVDPAFDAAACAFGFSLSIRPEDLARSGGNVAVILRWLQGDDESLFESFAGIIRRCLRNGATRPD